MDDGNELFVFSLATWVCGADESTFVTAVPEVDEDGSVDVEASCCMDEREVAAAATATAAAAAVAAAVLAVAAAWLMSMLS